MFFMNQYEIDMYLERTQGRPIQHKAARFLHAFMDEVNSHSDGWCYWKAPVTAAAKLMGLVQSQDEISEAQFKAALSPIKSFYTRRGTAAGMQFPAV